MDNVTNQQSTFAGLRTHQFINLTTFRKNGQPVVTPVWFAHDGDRLVGISQPQTGKVKRIRRNPQVTVAPSTASGKALGEAVNGVAHILPESEFPVAESALKRKYGLQYQMFRLVMKVRHTSHVFWEIRPA
ncbi:MAG: PPOX class F420-dependent oxidoreductase [Anaerolineae bacterium]